LRSLRIASVTGGGSSRAASGRGDVAPPRLPQLVDLPTLQRLSREVEELTSLLADGFVADEVDLEREIDLDRQAASQVIGAPVGAVREDDPLDALFNRVGR